MSFNSDTSLNTHPKLPYDISVLPQRDLRQQGPHGQQDPVALRRCGPDAVCPAAQEFRRGRRVRRVGEHDELSVDVAGAAAAGRAEADDARYRPRQPGVL